MANEYGIKETTEAVVLGCRIADAVEKSLADGQVSAWDAKNFIDVIPAIKPGINGYQLLGKELSDLSEDERLALMATIGAELDLDNDVVEQDAQDALDIITRIVAFSSKIRKRRNAKKAAQKEA